MNNFTSSRHWRFKTLPNIVDTGFHWRVSGSSNIHNNLDIQFVQNVPGYNSVLFSKITFCPANYRVSPGQTCICITSANFSGCNWHNLRRGRAASWDMTCLYQMWNGTGRRKQETISTHGLWWLKKRHWLVQEISSVHLLNPFITKTVCDLNFSSLQKLQLVIHMGLYILQMGVGIGKS